MTLHAFQRGSIAFHHGDCRHLAGELAGALGPFDAVVTDPPYHLTQASRGGSARQNDPDTPFGRTGLGSGGFMGKTWDGGDVAFQPETWATILASCKPGATLLSFGGTRTWHRLACAIEDGGWQIRDTLMWIYGSGFPKSLDISKAIDEAAGADNVIGTIPDRWTGKGNCLNFSTDRPQSECNVTAPATDTAKLFDGWGTALKPAWEPIILAMAPLAGTFAANALAQGVAGLNIDGCRIELNGDYKCRANGRPSQTGLGDNYDPTTANQHGTAGRFPANLILSHHAECVCVGTKSVESNGHYPASRGAGGNGTAGHSGQADLAERSPTTEQVESWQCHPDCPIAMLDEQAGPQSGGGTPPRRFADKTHNAYGAFTGQENPHGIGPSSGHVSRFFYCAKASTSERGKTNEHPTVKPLALMRYLCRLVKTPTGGTILDPFAGSGSTLIAAHAEGFSGAVGIEADPIHFQEGAARLRRELAQGVLF